MKMNKVILTTALSILAMTNNLALAENEVRLVLTEKMTASVKSAYNKSNVSKGHATNRLSTVTVQSNGLSVEEIKLSYESSGRYSSVEVDIEVKGFESKTTASGLATSAGEGDDSLSYYQDIYFDDNSVSPVGHNITSAKANVSQAGQAIDVFILDSGFFPSEDMVYGQGASFVTVDGQVRNNDFTPTVDVGDFYCYPHGQGVAGVIGAISSNEKGIAGVVDNVVLRPMRIMDCGTGYLSDIAAALNYISGEDFAEITPHNSKGGIVNMSLSADSDACPVFMQDSINKAIDAGYILVAASSNENNDLNTTVPSNCDGVISVAALNADADKADFSNYGSQIDISAMGENILAPCDDSPNGICFWEGTSFATPLVSGALALAYQNTPFDVSLAEELVKLSSHKFKSASSCSTETCGSGILNASGLVELAKKASSGLLNNISFAMGTQTSCDQTWLLEHFGGQSRLCELYRVKFLGGLGNEGDTYELFSYPKDEVFSIEIATLVNRFEKATSLMSNVDASMNAYKFRTCNNGICSDDMVDMDVSAALKENKPVSCE
jgi:uncharacterized protein YhfF